MYSRSGYGANPSSQPTSHGVDHTRSTLSMPPDQQVYEQSGGVTNSQMYPPAVQPQMLNSSIAQQQNQIANLQNILSTIQRVQQHSSFQQQTPQQLVQRRLQQPGIFRQAAPTPAGPVAADTYRPPSPQQYVHQGDPVGSYRTTSMSQQAPNLSMANQMNPYPGNASIGSSIATSIYQNRPDRAQFSEHYKTHSEHDNSYSDNNSAPSSNTRYSFPEPSAAKGYRPDFSVNDNQIERSSLMSVSNSQGVHATVRDNQRQNPGLNYQYQLQDMNTRGDQPYDPMYPGDEEDEAGVFKNKPVNIIKREEPGYVKINLKYQTEPEAGLSLKDSDEIWRYCELCNIRFAEKKHYMVHCAGMLHSEKLAQAKKQQYKPQLSSDKRKLEEFVQPSSIKYRNTDRSNKADSNQKVFEQVPQVSAPKRPFDLDGKLDYGKRKKASSPVGKLTLDDFQTGIWKHPNEMKHLKGGQERTNLSGIQQGDKNQLKRSSKELNNHGNSDTRSRSRYGTDESRHHTATSPTKDRQENRSGYDQSFGDNYTVCKDHTSSSRLTRSSSLETLYWRSDGDDTFASSTKDSLLKNKPELDSKPEQRHSATDGTELMTVKAMDIKQHGIGANKDNLIAVNLQSSQTAERLTLDQKKMVAKDHATDSENSYSDSDSVLKEQSEIRSSMTEEDTKVVDLLEPLFAHYKKEIIVASVMHPENRKGGYDTALLVQRCIEDLRILRTYKMKPIKSVAAKTKTSGSSTQKTIELKLGSGTMPKQPQKIKPELKSPVKNIPDKQNFPKTSADSSSVRNIKSGVMKYHVKHALDSESAKPAKQSNVSRWADKASKYDKSVLAKPPWLSKERETNTPQNNKNKAPWSVENPGVLKKDPNPIQNKASGLNENTRARSTQQSPDKLQNQPPWLRIDNSRIKQQVNMIANQHNEIEKVQPVQYGGRQILKHQFRLECNETYISQPDNRPFEQPCLGSVSQGADQSQYQQKTSNSDMDVQNWLRNQVPKDVLITSHQDTDDRLLFIDNKAEHPQSANKVSIEEVYGIIPPKTKGKDLYSSTSSRKKSPKTGRNEDKPSHSIVRTKEKNLHLNLSNSEKVVSSMTEEKKSLTGAVASSISKKKKVPTATLR